MHLRAVRLFGLLSTEPVMASSRIIRVPRTDEEGAYILGEVTPSGSKPLNVKFVATEGEEPYVVKRELVPSA